MVKDPSSTVVRIKESPGATVKVSKSPVLDDFGTNKSGVCSIKVEDSPCASVDLISMFACSDTPCSSSGYSSVNGEINLVNAEELIRIRTGVKLSDLSINAVQKMLREQFPKLNGLISTLLQEKNTTKPMRNQLQIIHSHEDHWIVASSVHCNSNEVFVYDSALLHNR